MKGSLLARLRRNGIAYIFGALLLLPIIPLYQVLILNPLGYATAFNVTGASHFAVSLAWIGNHALSFIIYRLLFAVAFALLLSFPFSLFRIVIAQELMAQQEREEQELLAEEDEDEEDEEPYDEEEDIEDVDEEEGEEVSAEEDGMPPYAWRGKGFAVLAAWAGLFGVIVYLLGTLASTLYFTLVGSSVAARLAPPANIETISGILNVITNTAGVGLLALSALFFGAMIARSGRNLWPGIWVAFGYTALAVAALLSGSAVAVASAPAGGQAALTAPAILLFALWLLWFGIMLARLKPEA